MRPRIAVDRDIRTTRERIFKDLPSGNREATVAEPPWRYINTDDVLAAMIIEKASGYAEQSLCESLEIAALKRPEVKLDRTAAVLQEWRQRQLLAQRLHRFVHGEA
ncbi:MAG: hypothetical protein ACREFV_10685, partial [Acetobacteraceae bacterium]